MTLIQPWFVKKKKGYHFYNQQSCYPFHLPAALFLCKIQKCSVLTVFSVQLQPWHFTAQCFNWILFFEQVWSYLTGSFSLCCILSAGWVRLWVWEQFTPPWLPAVPHVCCQRPLHHLRILLQGESQPLPSDPELKHGQFLCSQMSCHGRCNFCFYNNLMLIYKLMNKRDTACGKS